MAASGHNAPSARAKVAFQRSVDEQLCHDRRVWVRDRFLAGGFLLLGLAGIGILGAVSASAQGPSEYQVKAAFLYNFTKFIEWPAGTSRGNGDPLRVCVMGEDPFDHALEEVVKGKDLNGKTFEVRHVSNVQEARSCQVLFVGSSERSKVRSILEGLKGASVLTVGDTPGDAKQGCIIDFLIEDSKVRFEINVGAANLASLKVSSKLLSLAKVVWK
ncbi:MAG: YfiR family protein [Acidobacteriia bacterium]|nr:YfiR family protein [Terriglobia bacterium]